MQKWYVDTLAPHDLQSYYILRGGRTRDVPVWERHIDFVVISLKDLQYSKYYSFCGQAHGYIIIFFMDIYELCQK